jgi:hypothetical protein
VEIVADSRCVPSHSIYLRGRPPADRQRRSATGASSNVRTIASPWIQVLARSLQHNRVGRAAEVTAIRQLAVGSAWKQESRGCAAGVAALTFPYSYGSFRTSVIRHPVADRVLTRPQLLGKPRKYGLESG